MISYIITTIRPFEMAEKTIQSIKNLAPHNHEILVSSPNLYMKSECEKYNIKYVEDLGGRGSVGANNEAILHTKGDWLAFLPDDFKLQNLDINAFQEFLDGPEMGKKVFKMFSFHSYSAHKINGEYHTPIDKPYQIMHFPIVARETIENQLDGVIFNHRFKHAYPDHWLGFYASLHEQYEPFDYSRFGKDKLLIDLHSNIQYRNHTNDTHDYNTITELYQLSQNNVLGYND